MAYQYSPCLRGFDTNGRLIVRIGLNSGIAGASTCIVLDSTGSAHDLVQSLCARNTGASHWRLTVGRLDDPQSSACIALPNQLLSDIVIKQHYIHFAPPPSGLAPAPASSAVEAAAAEDASEVVNSSAAAAENASEVASSGSAAAAEDASEVVGSGGDSLWGTVGTEEAIEHSAQQALARSVQAEAEAGWEQVKPPKGAEGFSVSVLQRTKTIMLVKVECQMNASVGSILSLLREGRGGPKNATAQMLEQLTDTAGLMHIEVNVPIVKNRDFVCCQWLQASDGAAVVVRTAVPEPHATTFRAPNPKCVRGRIILQCTHVSALEGGRSSVKWVSCVDPGGV